MRNLGDTELKRLHREWRRKTEDRVALLLDDVQTPYNVGSIVRTAAALRVDVSDVLLSPRFNDSWTEALAAAQRLAAEALGADYCFFLVNGTTVGVHAMVLAAAAGRKIIVARNSHRSVVGAVVLADTRRLEGCFPAVDYCERRSIPFVVGVNCFEGAVRYPVEDVREALDLDSSIPVVLCDARERESVKQVLAAVVQHARHHAAAAGRRQVTT